MSRELLIVEQVAEIIRCNDSCLPIEKSFTDAFNACKDLFPTTLSQTNYINGALRYLRKNIYIGSSDARLRPCGPLLGVNRLTMRSARENLLYLIDSLSENIQ